MPSRIGRVRAAAAARKPLDVRPPVSVSPTRAKTLPPVYVALTTLPSRVALLWPVLHRLLHEQSVPAAAVIVNLPQEYASASLGKVDKVPDCWVARGSTKLFVNRRCPDLGPATKLLGCATARPAIPDGAVTLYVDDDHLYSRRLVQAHAEAHAARPTAVVVCGRGDVLADGGRDRESVRFVEALPVHLPCGVYGVSLRTTGALLAELAAEATALPRELRFVDDLMFGNAFARRGLAVVLLKDIGKPQLLKQSNDRFALHVGAREDCPGRTTERYVDGLARLAEAGALALATYHRAALAGDMWLYAHDPIPAARRNKHAILVFAWNRPDYFARTAASIAANLASGGRADAYDVVVLIDGAVNRFGGTARTAAARTAAVAAAARKHLPGAAVIRMAYNYGIGLMQHYGLELAHRLGYDRIVACEDDLVLGKHYLATLERLAPMLAECPAVAAVQGGYRKNGADPNEVVVQDSFAAHVHYWGWMTTRAKYAQIRAEYRGAARELFWEVDYVHSKERNGSARYVAWYKARGLKHNYRSQDWVRDGCFRLAGMTHKVYPTARRAAPIGKVGLHSTEKRFEELGLDDSTDDIDLPPPSGALLRVRTPGYDVMSLTASAYPQSITGVACYDHVLRDVFPDARRWTGLPPPGANPKRLGRPVVLADNHMVLEVPPTMPALIVHHGVAATHAERDPPWGHKSRALLVRQQQMLTQRHPRNTAVLSCSKFCTAEFARHYAGRYTQFANHAVPHTSALPQRVWKRRAVPAGARPVIVGDWRLPHKGQKLLPRLRKALPEFEFRQMHVDAPTPFDVAAFAQRKVDFYAAADMALMLSSHEGNSYFLLDAMQMDLVLVSTDVGLAPELDGGLVTTLGWKRAMAKEDVPYIAAAIRRAWKARRAPGAVSRACVELFGRIPYAAKTLGAIMQTAPRPAPAAPRPAPAEPRAVWSAQPRPRSRQRPAAGPVGRSRGRVRVV